MAENEKKRSKKSDIARREEEILAFWDEHAIFEKSQAKDAPKGEFVFYEGPPTANGRPGIHHIEARSFKDSIPRYKTMRGYHVRRKAGWDTHGLPVELEVEKKLGLKSKKEIEAYGVAKFNAMCKESVWQYAHEWERFTKRIAYWIDLDHPYITYEPPYIESVWNILKTVNAKGLLYKDYKVLPWCPRCGTALSSHELAQGYEDDNDSSVYVRFELVDEPGTYFLAWTTTPWTLPGNVALAVGENIDYVKVLAEKLVDSHGLTNVDIKECLSSSEKLPVTLMKNPPVVKLKQEILIFAKDQFSRIQKLVEEEYTLKVLEEKKGKDFVGKKYKPLYSYMEKLSGQSAQGLEKAFQVYPADFVTTTDGTGIVHTAVMYGQEDFDLGARVGLPKFHLVDETGHFIAGMDFLSGMFVKPDDKSTEVAIIKDIDARGFLFKEENYVHSYPHCWRCKTPVIYYARTSWYIAMSKLRDELVRENDGIHWEPESIKEGRFGEWLRGVKDWALSRERYWGTPLPVWESLSGAHREVIGSIDELKEKTRSTNRYLVMRHGEAESNVRNIVSGRADDPYHLTEKGKRDVEKEIHMLKEAKIDMIVASPFVRTRETTEIVAHALGLSKDAIIYDDRLREVDTGEFSGKPIDDYRAYFVSQEEKFVKPAPGGETLTMLKNRVMEFLYETDAAYEGTTILIISHEYPIWLMTAGASGLDVKGSVVLKADVDDFIATGEARDFSFAPLPHNETYELDLHKPYIDAITWKTPDGSLMRRVPEVADVWFDSGAMPFAQDHYPFEHAAWVDGPGYPADYISEAIDQTRGWFYTLHAIGVLMGRGKAYKNVLCLGHILDAHGKKMSKSLGNTVDPWTMIDRYGVDTLRFWMQSINAPGESKNFDEKTVDEVVKKVFNLLFNVVKFYELFADTVSAEALAAVDPRKSPHILDRWIIALLDKLIADATAGMDAYSIFEPARAIRDFIGELSQWYIRRSRERFKSDELPDKRYALATTRYVLRELAKVMAPFAPFAAEMVYQKVKSEDGKESVHLENWPQEVLVDQDTIALMAQARIVVSLGLESRAHAGIKIRQPLSLLTIKEEGFAKHPDLLKVIADELNVKEINIDTGSSTDILLDTTITPELKKEGQLRDLIRFVQDLRKKAGLAPADTALVTINANEKGKEFFSGLEGALKEAARLSAIVYAETTGEKLALDEIQLEIQLTASLSK